MKYIRPFEARKLDRAFDAHHKAWKEQHEGPMKWNGETMEKAFCEANGLTHHTGSLFGKIGNGTKTHRFSCRWGTNEAGEAFVFSAYSFCGSQRWGQGGRSRLYLTEADTCDCKKCNK